MNISSACVNHRPYFRHPTIQITIDFESTGSAEMQTYSRVLGLIPAPLYGGNTATVHVNTWTFNINKANTKHHFLSPRDFPCAQIVEESFVPMLTGLSNSLEKLLQKRCLGLFGGGALLRNNTL